MQKLKRNIIRYVALIFFIILALFSKEVYKNYKLYEYISSSININDIKNYKKYYITSNYFNNFVCNYVRKNPKKIYVVDYEKQKIRGAKGKVYFPGEIAKYAFTLLGLSNNMKDIYFTTAQVNIRWLLENYIVQYNTVTWLHNFKFGNQYDMNPGWTSAISQGWILSALSRYYMFLKDENEKDKLKDIISKAVNFYEISVKDKGFTHKVDDYYIYEEYPDYKNNNIRFVFNGHMTALLGLYDAYQFTNNREALRLFNLGVKALLVNLDKIDTGYWTKYSLIEPSFYNHFSLASPVYNSIHAKEFKVLYLITSIEEFNTVSVKAEQYQNSYFGFFMKLIYAIYKVLLNV